MKRLEKVKKFKIQSYTPNQQSGRTIAACWAAVDKALNADATLLEITIVPFEEMADLKSEIDRLRESHKKACNVLQIYAEGEDAGYRYAAEYLSSLKPRPGRDGA